MGEFTPSEQFLSDFSSATHNKLVSYVPITPTAVEMGEKQKMAVDPSDNIVALIPIHAEGFKTSSYRDIYGLFKVMHEAATLASEDAGFVVYPFLQIEE